jgi:hypothetical protein
MSHKFSPGALVAGALVAGAVALGLGALDDLVRAEGGSAFEWTTRAAISLVFGVVVYSLVLVVGRNRKLKLASAELDRRAKQFAPDPRLGSVYVFRDAYMGKLVGVDILVDGAPAAQTRGKTFLRVDLTPGRHVVTSVNPFEDNRVDLPVEVEAGGVAYVEHGLKMGLVGSRYTLSTVTPTEAQRRIRRCRLLAPTPQTPRTSVSATT